MERLRFRTMGEILYELMTGLLFYPRTLWRVLLWPAEASATSQAGREEGDLISPPLFLLISILLAQALDLFLRGELGEAAASSGLGPLLFRAVAFSLFPLVMAVGTLRRQGRPVDHATLREPFELQCLCAAPFALSLSVAVILIASPTASTRLAGAAIGLAAVAWYLCVQTRWLHRRLAVGSFRAFRTATWLFAVALFCCLPPALLILGPRGP
ncbi:hypothetical protein ASD21_06445 [Caulobacter sp. Root1455]|uniref:hypothetical protein n=1 Tax=unclassified Caulobacter TaxID=2648921 RepID=UPI0007141E13|nr:MULTISPECIES: hypothetical protein [unclassified Caulobacter]KQY96137.1 hypothetical protein ASD21_06445 [Caulobacter sp. Root1455]